MERICILSKLSCYQLKRDNYYYYYYWIFNASLMELQLKTYSWYTEEKDMGIKTYHYKKWSNHKFSMKKEKKQRNYVRARKHWIR